MDPIIATTSEEQYRLRTERPRSETIDNLSLPEAEQIGWQNDS